MIYSLNYLVYVRVSTACSSSTLSVCMPAVQVHSSTTRGSAADATETTDAGCWSTCGQSTATDGSL